MNSDEERAMFEDCGWEYDYIKRRWVSPDGEGWISIDVVVAVSSEGPKGEERLRAMVERRCREG